MIFTMERYGYIFGTDSVGEYTEIVSSPGIRDFVQKHGTPFPMDALDQMLKLLGGYEFLPGYESQPEKSKPVAMRYVPLHMGGLYDMPVNMKPVYALCVSGMELQMGYKKIGYDALVVMDHRELIRGGELSCMDQILGTYLLSSQEANAMRRKASRTNPALLPEKVAVPNRKEDTDAVLNILEGLLSGKRVVVRLEKGHAFNTRAMEILSQVYSLLHPRLAAETGFATYHNPSQLNDLAKMTGIRLFVLPGEAESVVLPDNGVLVDLAQKQENQVTNLMKCLKLWLTVKPEDRMETLSKVFADPKLDVWDSNKFMVETVKFFGDPFFKYKPTQGKCATLEELKAEYMKFPALKLDIGWVLKRFAAHLPVLLPAGVKLGEWKANAVASLSGAADEDTRKKYMDLYTFAQKLDDGDASQYAVIQTRKVVQEQADAKCQEQQSAFDQKLAELTRSHDKALTDQKTAHAKALAEQKASHDKAMAEERSAHQKALAAQKTAGDKALADAKKNLGDELSKAKSAAAASSQQITGLQKQLQDQKSSYEGEIRRLKNQPASGSGDVAALRKQMEEMKAAHAAELRKAQQQAQQPAAAVTVSASARSVSERAKQMMAAQILYNLAQTEEREAKNGNQ